MRGSSSFDNLSDALGASSGTPRESSPSKRQDSQITEEIKLGSEELPLTLYNFNPSEENRKAIQGRKLHPQYKNLVEEAINKRLRFDELSDKSKNSSNDRDEFDIQQRDMRSFSGVDVTLYRFVILRNGRMVCGDNYEGEARSHENLADCDGVLAAGEFGFDTSGCIRYVSNRTGHYRVPPEVLSKVVLPCLEAHGCTVDVLRTLYVDKYSNNQAESGEPAQLFSDYKSSSSSSVKKEEGSQSCAQDSNTELLGFFQAAKAKADQEAAAQAKDRRVPVRNARFFRLGDTDGASGVSLFADLSSDQLSISRSSASSDIQKGKREGSSSDENQSPSNWPPALSFEGATRQRKAKRSRGDEPSTTRKLLWNVLSSGGIPGGVEDAEQVQDEKETLFDPCLSPPRTPS